ncbi:hypothetical protein BDV19DRAFT_205684 [Aspergillus venezuelensis]
MSIAAKTIARSQKSLLGFLACGAWRTILTWPISGVDGREAKLRSSRMEPLDCRCSVQCDHVLAEDCPLELQLYSRPSRRSNQ